MEAAWESDAGTTPLYSRMMLRRYSMTCQPADICSAERVGIRWTTGCKSCHYTQSGCCCLIAGLPLLASRNLVIFCPLLTGFCDGLDNRLTGFCTGFGNCFCIHQHTALKR